MAGTFIAIQKLFAKYRLRLKQYFILIHKYIIVSGDKMTLGHSEVAAYQGHLDPFSSLLTTIQ